MKNLTRRCCICGSIELNGSLVQKGNYDEKEFEFTDTILSRECLLNQYIQAGVDEERARILVSRKSPDYETCNKNFKY